MKRQIHIIAFAILFLFLMPLGAQAAELLIPGGQIIGLQLQDGSVTVAAFDDVLGASARQAGIKIGDELLSINGKAISSAEDVRSALEGRESPVTVSFRRGSRQQSVEVLPRQTEEGPRLGLHLKQGITGIGTVSWYDPETKKFGTLGHGVHDSRGGLLKMTAGTACHGQVISVKKGLRGEPGLLKGGADPLGICGQLIRNTPQGVFGISQEGWRGEPLPVADFEEVEPGAAMIRSTVAGSSVQEYSVEILKIYPEERSDGRNFLLKVTDPDLLAATGGIVQGMGVSYNRDNTGTLRSLQGLGDSPGFSLTKRNPCTRAGTQGRTSFVSSDQAIRMKYIERRFDNLSTLIKQPNIILPHRIRHRAVSVTLFGVFLFDAITDWRKI